MPEMFPIITLVAGAYYALTVLFLRSGLLRLRSAPRSEAQPTVSVLVAARNEENVLSRCLNALLNQVYPTERLQIVVADDRSTDRTPEILARYQPRFAGRLVVVRVDAVPAGLSPKKHALTQAVPRATGELLLTTDADCVPPPNWVADTVARFTDSVGVVIGPAPFFPERRLLNRVQRVENLTRELVAAGAAGWNLGVTATGRNLAYRRQVFEQVNGFAASRHSLSGDDDLFVQQVARRTDWNITYNLNPAVAVPSPAPGRVGSFLAQYRRHISAGKHYAPGLKLAFFGFNLANLCLFLFFAMTIFGIQAYFHLAAGLLGAKVLLDFAALFSLASKLKRTRDLLWLPVWELFYVLNQTFVAPLAFLGKIKWKG